MLCGDPTKPSLPVSRIRFSPGWKDSLRQRIHKMQQIRA